MFSFTRRQLQWLIAGNTAVFPLMSAVAIWGWFAPPRAPPKPVRWPGMERLAENAEAVRQAALPENP